VSDTPLPPAGWTPGENVIREALKAVARNALRPENVRQSLNDVIPRLIGLLEGIDTQTWAERLSAAALGLVLPLFDAQHPVGAAPTFGTPRNPAWERESQEFRRANPHCHVCGTTEGCVVHHKYPLHLYPELEMDRRYWRTVCPRDHFLVDHLCDWRAYNPDCDQDGAKLYHKIINREYHRVAVMTAGE
jgi:hypothetical protein